MKHMRGSNSINSFIGKEVILMTNFCINVIFLLYNTIVEFILDCDHNFTLQWKFEGGDCQ